jgi:soluble lytic murein transglycosylase-like protein
MTMFGSLPRAMLVALILLPAATARADIYSFTDESGALHLSNVPVESRYRLQFSESKPTGEPKISPDATQVAARPAPTPGAWEALIQKTARAHSLEPALLHAVIRAESGYNPRAVSPKGAKGLMQLMPATARRYGVGDPYDPRQNLEAGARYLRDLLKLFNQDLRLALAAYNAGEQAVIRYHRRIPPFPETMHYVPKVLDWYRKYRAGHTAGV